MKEIYFLIEEAAEGGYIASAIGQSIVTEAETIPELKLNIKEALECHFENPLDRPLFAQLHFVKDETLVL